MKKLDFDIDHAIPHIREAVSTLPKAAMFELFDEGYRTPFEQLVACVISIRTYDEVSLPAAKRLFAVARTPHDVGALAPSQIDALIRPATFHDRKAHHIRGIAQAVAIEHGGDLPCDPAVLMGFEGVGPKCANLALGIACNVPVISVDVHVHRVTNRWGYVQTTSPERTMDALEQILPQQYWIEINRLLVPFGKHVCTGTLPRCSSCPVLDMCRQVGVDRHR